MSNPTSRSRRRALQTIAASPALLAAPFAAAAPTKRPSKNFVLVHGAWHGGWCWRHVRAALEAAGHRVFTPTLTGMGERNHLSTRTTDVAVHIRDVLAVIEAEELNDVVLVGHSYGGYPVSGAAATMPGSISHLIHLDAVIPTPGRAFNADWPAPMKDGVQRGLIDGFRLPPLPPEMFDVPPADAANTAWLKRRLTDMPYPCLNLPYPEPPAVSSSSKPAISFITCTESKLDGPRAGLAAAEKAGWKIHRLKSGHDAMITAHVALSKMVLDIAGTKRA
jgi:pimeloyl-ACP methyl ester carboxylesterase